MIDGLVKELGDGEIIKISTNEYIFKLSSYKSNPIIKPQDLGLIWEEPTPQTSNRKSRLNVGAVFNGGAEFFEDKIMLTPRCHKGYKKGKFVDPRTHLERDCLENYISEVWILSSKDGVKFNRFHNIVIKGDGSKHQDFIYGIEDIRIVRHTAKGGVYWLIGCGKVGPPFKAPNSDRIAIYSTNDFVNITYHGIVNCFDSRNAVLFPDYINGELYMLFRFHPNIHIDTVKIEQLDKPRNYEDEWRRIYNHRDENILFEAGRYSHENEKIGPSTQVIKTDRGWLLIYHAVGEIGVEICEAYGIKGKIKRGYSVCAALLELDNPRSVISRTPNPIYIPSAAYELYGDTQYPVDIPAVVFPVGAVVNNDKLLLYCGAGDKYTILLSCELNKLVDYLMSISRGGI